MSLIELEQPTIIIMLGYPGAGKTYFARNLVENSEEMIHLSEDRVRHELFEEAEYSKSENEVVDRIMLYMIETCLSSGMSIIYDGNTLKRATRRKLADIARKNRMRSLIVWVQTDVETSFDRSTKRDRRKADDKYSQDMPFSTFDKLTKQFQKPNYEDYVVISGKHVFRTQAASVKKKLMQMTINNEQQRIETQSNMASKGKVMLGGRVDMRRRRKGISLR